MDSYIGKLSRCLQFYSRERDNFPYDAVKTIITNIYKNYMDFQNELGGTSNKTSTINPMMIDSIVQRYKLIIDNGIDGITYVSSTKFKTREECNILNSLQTKQTGVYRVDYSQGEKVDLYYKHIETNFSHSNSNRPVYISLDLETGRIFVKSLVYVNDKTNVSLVTYCLPSYLELQYLFLGQKEKKNFVRKSQPASDDCIENIVICDSFHPTSMKDKDKNNKNRVYPHINHIDKLDISDEEKYLMKYFYGEGAPEPHFHCHSERISIAVGGNDKSFAIHFYDLKKYIGMMVECAEKHKIDVLIPELQEKYKNVDFGILKYDLDMPYLSVLKGTLIYENANFIENMDKLLKEYASTTKTKSEKIEQIFKMLDSMKKNRKSGGGGKKNIGVAALRSMIQDLTALEAMIDSLPPDFQVSAFDIFSGNLSSNNSPSSPGYASSANGPTQS